MRARAGPRPEDSLGTGVADAAGVTEPETPRGWPSTGLLPRGPGRGSHGSCGARARGASEPVAALGLSLDAPLASVLGRPRGPLPAADGSRWLLGAELAHLVLPFWELDPGSTPPGHNGKN